MRRLSHLLTVVTVAVGVAVGTGACDDPQSPTDPPASSAAAATPEHRRPGDTYRYHDGPIDATVTVDRFRETAPPPGDLIAVAVVVEVHGGTWTFGPDLVRFAYDGEDRGTGTVVAGPSASAPLGPGTSTRWALRFAAPASTTGPKITVEARTSVPLAEWFL